MKVKIPTALREQVWRNAFGEKFFKNKCSVAWCETMVTPFDFHTGHNIPESKGGTLDLTNLKPICARCNLSMGDRYTIDGFSTLTGLEKDPPKKLFEVRFATWQVPCLGPPGSLRG
jgi:hypothetical protein